MPSEKEKIEIATADAFIDLYNAKMNSSFKVLEYSDAPDVRCKDASGNVLNLEITLTEDRAGDIPAILGRSDHKSIVSQLEHLNKVKAGKASIFEQVSSLSENVAATLIQRIKAKSKKDYGANVALVIRDSSPVGWDWEHIVPEIKAQLSEIRLPFEHGVWLLTFTKDRIIQIV